MLGQDVTPAGHDPMAGQMMAPTDAEIETRRVDQATTLTLDLHASGGAAIRITPR